MSCLMFDDEAVAGLIPERGSVSVTADGAKTYGTLLSELYALVDRNKIGVDTALLFDLGTLVYNYKFCAMTASAIILATGEISTQDNAEYLTFLFVLGSASVAKYRKVKASSPYVENTSQTSSVPTSGSKFTLYY